jgi:hypothetical protein
MGSSPERFSGKFFLSFWLPNYGVGKIKAIGTLRTRAMRLGGSYRRSEVPASQAAGSFQGLQIDKRHSKITSAPIPKFASPDRTTFMRTSESKEH